MANSLFPVSPASLPPLHAACLQGDLAAVKSLCKEAGVAATHDANVRTSPHRRGLNTVCCELTVVCASWVYPRA